MSDKELLALAAKAYGAKMSDYSDRTPDHWIAERVEGSRSWYAWDPMNDDGDALRLAAKLRISIDFKDCCAWSRGVFGLVQEFWGGDYPNCYRNAIVRAAAEIGKEQA